MVEPSEAIENSANMTEYEKRLKRAQRFGLEVSEVVGPSTENNYTGMDTSVAAQCKITRINEHIDRIKHRQEKFSEESLPQADDKINELEGRIEKLHNVAKPEEIKSSAEIIPDSLYLYGTDYMSNSDIKNYVIQTPNVKIQWINDSSCTLKFDATEEAERAYRIYSVKPLEMDLSLGFDERNFDSRIGWREALGF